MRTLYLLVFTLSIYVLPAHAQVPAKDSLLYILKNKADDTTKIKPLFELVSEYVQFNTDTAILFHQQGKQLIDKLNAHQYDFEYYFSGIKIYHATQDFDKALEYNLNAVATADKNQNLSDKADALRALFMIYLNLNRDSLAIQTAHEALRLTEQLKDTVNLPITFGNLSRLYYELGQLNKAIDYGKEGIEAGKKYNSMKGLLISLNNTALSYMETGQTKEAEKLYKEQLSLAYKNNIPRSVVKALLNLCFIHSNAGAKIPLQQYTRELNNFVANNADAPIAKSDLKYLPLLNGYSLLFDLNYSNAEKVALSGLPGAQKNEQLLIQLYDLLVKINYAKADFSRGEWYENKSDSIQEVLNKEDLAGYEIEFDKKYQSEKKDSQIKLQQASIKQKSTLNYILIGGAASLLLISLLGYRNYKHKQKLQQQRINELETEKQLTATEAVLKGEEQERTRLAKDLHDGLGGMLSGIKYSFQTMKGNLVMTPENHQAFERSMDMLDSSIKEMRRVAHNMMPEALVKFGLDTALKDFCNDINQSGALRVTYQSIGLEQAAIGQTSAITIYRIVQELINNIMKHASAETAIVQVTKTDGNISITVEDDGKGFDPVILQSSKGIGWTNIQSRVEYLKGNLDVKSAPGKGVSVLIELKNV